MKRLFLDGDRAAPGLVLERIEALRSDGEHELPRQPARSALADLVRGPVGQHLAVQMRRSAISHAIPPPPPD
jgi:hypothetical protein